jgi:diadenosine tetraphosphate (Ap4A) HIT family hydrolase
LTRSEKKIKACELCAPVTATIAWEDALCYVVSVGGEEGLSFPGFCRVIWRAHACEMTDLPTSQRRHFMSVVFAVEAAVRRLAKPDKINLASLGNAVAHLHWHVIPRWREDSHYPAPIWANSLRLRIERSSGVTIEALHNAISAALAEEQSGS